VIKTQKKEKERNIQIYAHFTNASWVHAYADRAALLRQPVFNEPHQSLNEPNSLPGWLHLTINKRVDFNNNDTLAEVSIPHRG